MSDQTVHLLVLIHGMWGNPSNLASMHRIIEQTRVHQSSVNPDGTELHVMLAETNQAESTYDGIDWGGDREIRKGGKKVTRFSVTGYSLGGLLARYVVGILHQRNFFVAVTPVNFNTIATPHIGLLEYPSLRSRLSSIVVPRFFSRTGKQFYAVDRWSNTGKSLLEIMTDPAHVFYQGLKLFPHIRIYANAINDVTVPYLTAYVDLEDPFISHTTDDLAVEYDDKYFPIIKSFTRQDTPTPKRGPRPYSLAWFRTYKPPLPPRLQAPFPFNIATAVLIPILLPIILILVLIRISISSYHSRSRIRLLESEDASATQRLVHVFGQLERRVEDIVADMADDPATLVPSPNGNQAAKVALRVTPAQRRMVAALNTLPQLKKERAFITDVINSHATIIARDIKNYEFHKIGEGVLRHWADAFIL
ncbi:DUF676-domain-containing protein [Lactarius pseudohatsudake]|nr:DUF676-domain-containing protein [Lactarius pseudohatsudake]